jgi:hypothetical protein
MVDQIASSTSVQSAGASQQERNPSQRQTAAEIYMKALNDAVTLSSQALQILNQLSKRTSIAEAWLDHLTDPPNLNDPANSASAPVASASASSGGDPQAVMRTSLNRAKTDMSWLLETMAPPKVDIKQVVQVLAARITADNVGVRPPVDQVIAQAEQNDTVPVMYAENLSITTARNGDTTASVDRVTLTAVDPSLLQGAGEDKTPLVLDLGGQAKSVPESQLLPAEKKLREQTEPRALMVIRQGGTALPEGTLHVKMDLLIPIA